MRGKGAVRAGAHGGDRHQRGFAQPALAFPGFEPALLEPWVEQERERLSPELLAARAQELPDKRRAALAEWQLGEPELAAYCAGTAVRVLTPGARIGESH